MNKVTCILERLEDWFKENGDLYTPRLGDPFKILISTIISSRTKEETTAEVSERLFKRFPDVESLSKADPKEVEKLIYPAGFYKTKAPRLVEIARIILEEYNGKVPDTLEELVKLPGVGRKTANIVLAYGFGKPAIAVDTHVHRIANRLGLVKTKTPVETEKALKKIIPKSKWREINEVFVSFGRRVCKPINPRCDQCPIKQCCEYYKRNKRV